MALVTFRIPDDLADRFTAHARGLGGKSAALRRLVEDALRSAAPHAAVGGVAQPSEPADDRDAQRGEARGGDSASASLPAVVAALGPSTKVTLRLGENEVARVAEVARRRGMTRTRWIASLVRARLRLDLPQTGDERAALRAIARELNRIGGNINQIARAMNSEAPKSGGLAPGDLAVLGDAREAVQAASAELRFVLARSAGYWDVTS